MHSIPPINDTAFERGSAVVSVLALEEHVPPDGAPGAHRHVHAQGAPLCLDPSVAVLIVGTAAAIEQVAQGLSPDFAERATALVVEAQASTTEMVNAAIVATAPADLVLLAPGVRVAAGWFARLRAAATSDSTVASATPLSLTPVTLDTLAHLDDRPITDGADDGLHLTIAAGTGATSAGEEPRPSLEESARRVAEHAEDLRPRIASVGPACAYIRRPALELVGVLQGELPLAAAMDDFALRTLAAGMVHVAADDVLIESTRPVNNPSSTARAVQETLVEDERGRLRRAIALARTAVRRLSVTIDGRALTPMVGGTQTYIIELILALAKDPQVAVRVLSPPDLSARAAAALAEAEVELLSYDDAVAGAPKTDVVHRPQSIFTPDDLSLLKLVGERIVIGQLDMIAYHNYTYHADIDRWRAYRRTTRLALGAADQVVFFSEHAQGDALAEDLLPRTRSHVVSIGGDELEHFEGLATAPPGLCAGEPFLLCLGADYRHKNRVFAIELLAALSELGWGGRLVFAGTHVPFGSSSESERVLLDARADLASHTLDLGRIDGGTRSWLYRHARALLYPTVYEGFGLLPLEAARAQLPCFFAAQASLGEAAGEAATLIPWNARESAAAVLALLAPGPKRETHLARLRELPIPTWDRVASQLLSVYREALAAPRAEGAGSIWQELDRESFITSLDRDVKGLKETAQEYQDAYHSLHERVAGGLALIDRGGLLSEEQQRGLMRLARRRGLRAPLLGALGTLGWRRSERS